MTDWYQIVKQIATLEAEAEQRGDDRASGMLRVIGAAVMAAQADLVAAEVRREKDRQRKRDKAKPSTDSTESGESTESVEKSGFPPDPLSQKRTTTPQLHRAREAGMQVELVDSDGVPIAQFDEIDEAVMKFARDFPVAWGSVNPFLCRRPLRTWLGWIKEMRKCLVGSQYTEEDMATTCDHDATLTRQIGTPIGLSSFLNRTRMARMNPPNLERESSPKGPRRNAGAEQVENIAKIFRRPA